MTTHATRRDTDDTDAYQVLTFKLGGETYGIDILRVQEIRGWSGVTQLPGTAEHVLGVLNLRGAVVPIVDLRKLFSLERAEYTVVTVIIVLSVHCKTGQQDVGIVVDAVSDVTDIHSAAIKPAPDIGSLKANEHIRGLATAGERLIILLDIDRLLSAHGSRQDNCAGADTANGA